MVTRCASVANVTTTAMPYAQPMPGPPMTRPLNTDVMAKETPVTVPTMPLARSRRSSGTSSVTQVDSTIPRSCPATEPRSVAAVSTQNQGLLSRRRSSLSIATNTVAARVKLAAETAVIPTSAVCLRCRSAKVPTKGPSTAEAMLKAPPMTPVATTERVSRYTQNVRANHRNELFTPLARVFTSRRRKTGGIGARRAAAAPPPDMVVTRSSSIDRLIGGPMCHRTVSTSPGHRTHRSAGRRRLTVRRGSRSAIGFPSLRDGGRRAVRWEGPAGRNGVAWLTRGPSPSRPWSSCPRCTRLRCA
jgi:hypothetical protein